MKEIPEYPLKRVSDFVLAVAGLYLSSPLWLLFSLAIWLQDGGEVFFCQERVGRAGVLFKNIKFRSMIRDAERDTGPIQARENDPRVTRIGRFMRRTAMDELPQLVNIALGEMSFVGPRPLRPEEMQWGGTGSSFKARLVVRPGLTGVAQVCAPRDISVEEKVRYDLWYIEHQGFFLDISLIVQSFWISFSRRWDTGRRGFPGLLKV